MNPQEKPKSKAHGRSKGAADPGRSERDAPPVAQPAQPAESDWHESAAFQVSFDQTIGQAGDLSWRTRAYREETDDHAVWPGVASDALIDWMRDKARLPITQPTAEPRATRSAGEPTAETPTAPPVPAPATETANDLRLDIGGMAIEEIAAEQQVSGPPIAKRLRAQIEFQLCNAAAYLIAARQTSYVVQIVASDLETGGASVLATGQQQLRPESLEYSATIDFELPALGRYQLVGMVLLPDDGTVGVTLGPALTVVP